jgi:integrase
VTDMPRPRPPHLHKETNRHGKIVWYVRVGHGPRIRIHGAPGTEAFNAAYQRAIGITPDQKQNPSKQSLAWLIDRYMETSAAWFALSKATRKQRASIFNRIKESAGKEPISAITRNVIATGRDRRAKNTPNAARHFVQAMRGLFAWAVEMELANENPAEGVKVNRPQTEGFKVWPDEWCQAYEARWPLGTRERVWYEVLYCTGLRRGDAVRVGRQHVKSGRGMIRAEKNGETAYFIVTERLQKAFDAGETGDLTWIVGGRKTPITKESFGNYFRKACRAAGVPGSAHGIRKTRATIEAESGASGARLDALFGWKTGSNTSAIYIRKANRAKLAFGE